MKTAAEAFIAAAKTYVEWVELVASGNPATINLFALYRSLLQLQRAASELPSGMSDADFNDAAEAFQDRLERDPHIQQGLAVRLPISQYRVVFDPFDESEREAIVSTLDDDLAEIYWDVVEGIALANAGFYGDAVFQWRFLFFTHWGRHAVHAQSAIWQYLAENRFE